MRTGPYTGGAVLLPWDAIDLGVRRKLLRARTIAVENRRSDTRALLGLATACGFALLVVSGSGFGQLSHSWLAQGGWFIVSYGLLLAGVIVPSAWLARRIFSRHSWLPFERALLPLDAIEATRKGLVVRPFGDARFAEMKDGVFEIAYADTSTFRIRLEPTVDESELLAAETTLERASLTTDDAYRASVDPFHDLRGDKGLRAHPRAIAIEAPAAWQGRSAELATMMMVLASFVLATFLVGLRNRMSDDAAFAFARHENARVHYEAYLDSGGTRHAREVREDLLPRSALDDARAHGDPDAIGAFLEHFPKSRFDAEARAALDRACMSVGESYTKSSRDDLFEDLGRFQREHPVCADERGAISGRWFEAKRRALRDDAELEPELREAFIGVVDRAEREGRVIPFRVSILPLTLGGADHFTLVNGLRALVGPVIQPRVGSPAGERDYVEIQLLAMLCEPGRHPVGGSRNVHLHIWRDGTERASWWRTVRDTSELFTALTTNQEPAMYALCAPVMP